MFPSVQRSSPLSVFLFLDGMISLFFTLHRFTIGNRENMQSIPFYFSKSRFQGPACSHINFAWFQYYFMKESLRVDMYRVVFTSEAFIENEREHAHQNYLYINLL